MEQINIQYKDYLQPEKAYEFLLKIQKDIKKALQKAKFDLFKNTAIFGLSHLNNLGEEESTSSLLNLIITEYTKTQKSKEINKLEFLESFKEIFNAALDKSDKHLFRLEFIKFCNLKGINEAMLQKFNFFEIFCKDALITNNFIDAYKFAIKADNENLLFKTVQIICNSGKLSSDKEKLYFICRTTLELIINKQLRNSFLFISRFVDLNNNLQNNPPVLNFAYSLVVVLTETIHDFNNFWSIINIYKKVCEEEYYYQFYLNRISEIYFNKTIVQEESPFSMGNMLKMFAGKK